MKTKLVGLIAIGGLALTGCASSSVEASGPTPQADSNQAACFEAQQFSERVAKTMAGDLDDDFLASIRGRYDSIALSAEGLIQDRLLAIVDTIPDRPAMWVVEPANDYFQALEDLGRACDSEYDFGFQAWTWG